MGCRPAATHRKRTRDKVARSVGQARKLCLERALVPDPGPTLGSRPRESRSWYRLPGSNGGPLDPQSISWRQIALISLCFRQSCRNLVATVKAGGGNGDQTAHLG